MEMLRLIRVWNVNAAVDGVHDVNDHGIKFDFWLLLKERCSQSGKVYGC